VRRLQSTSPSTPIVCAQFDLIFDNSLATVTSVTEGNLLNQDGAATLFNSGTINTVTGAFSWTPEAAGTDVITFEVTDGYLSAGI
jgi:hypothetical protein